MHSDRRLGVRVLAEELNMNRETVRQIVKEELGMKKISAKMVPRILPYEQKRQLHISSDLLRNADMSNRVITSDETWCFQNNTTCSVEQRIHLGQKKHACLSRRSRPCLCVSSITRG
jgi:AraC-like DNA-binding protein